MKIHTTARVATRRTAAAHWLEVARSVVANSQHATVDGVLLDLFTASTLVQVHDSLNEANQQRLVAMGLPQAADFVMKLVARTKQSAVKRSLAALTATSVGSTYQVKRHHTPTWLPAGESTDEAAQVIRENADPADDSVWLMRNNFNGAVNVYLVSPAVMRVNPAFGVENKGSFQQFYGQPYREASLKVAGHSDTCPKCKAHMDDVTVAGDTLTATCAGCGWTGTKTKSGGAPAEKAPEGETKGGAGADNPFPPKTKESAHHHLFAAGEQCPGVGRGLMGGQRVTEGSLFGKVLGKCPVCGVAKASRDGSTPRHVGAKTAAVTAMPNPVDLGVKVGDFFVDSWGYDQTNIDFYEVVGLTGASVKVVQVGSKVVGEQGGPQESVVPIPGSGAGGTVLTKRIQQYGAEPSFTVNSFSTAFKWNGKPQSRTGYGWGH